MFHNFPHFYKVCQKINLLIFNYLGIFFKFGTLFTIYKGANQLKRFKMDNTIKINAAHYEAGKRDHENGYYDKWYRYNAKNDGYSYEMGWHSVTSDRDITIIECN